MKKKTDYGLMRCLDWCTSFTKLVPEPSMFYCDDGIWKTRYENIEAKQFCHPPKPPFETGILRTFTTNFANHNRYDMSWVKTDILILRNPFGYGNVVDPDFQDKNPELMSVEFYLNRLNPKTNIADILSSGLSSFAIDMVDDRGYGFHIAKRGWPEDNYSFKDGKYNTAQIRDNLFDFQELLLENGFQNFL